MKGCLPRALAALALLVLAAVGWNLYRRVSDDASDDRGQSAPRAFPVETAPVQRADVEERRTFSGSLEPSADITIASNLAGRVVRVHVDLADSVRRGQVLIELDDAEYRQEVARAEADLAVAEARRDEAANRLNPARREWERARQLAERGVSSAAAKDAAETELLVRTAAADVAEAEVHAARAALEAARLRLADTRVRAEWTEGDDLRAVAERWVDEGDTIAPNTPLIRVVEPDPVRAVIHVPERDYARLAPGQKVQLATDAWPDVSFPAEIRRISPVFREASRQARVEILSENSDGRLKPGMFVRATVILDREENARLVPESALTQRDGATGLFQVNETDRTAVWIPVTTGIRDRGLVQVLDGAPAGRVVTLGQQLLEDGSPLLLPEDGDPDA